MEQGKGGHLHKPSHALKTLSNTAVDISVDAAESKYCRHISLLQIEHLIDAYQSIIAATHYYGDPFFFMYLR